MQSNTRALELQEYLDLEYPFVVSVDREESGYVIEFPDLPGCMTQSETLDEIPGLANDARTIWLETAFDEGIEIPLPSYPESYSGKFNLRLPRSLHRRLAESAASEGVSLNQLVVALLSESLVLRRVERRLERIEAQAELDPRWQQPSLELTENASV